MSRYLSFVADLTKESFGCSNNGASRTDITFVTFTTSLSLASRSLRFTRLSYKKISSLLRATTKNSEEENRLSEDGKTSWLEVECLGACVNAPMLQLNEDYYEDLDPTKLEQIIDKISNDEVPQPGSYRGRLSSEPENTRKTLIGNKNA